MGDFCEVKPLSLTSEHHDGTLHQAALSICVHQNSFCIISISSSFAVVDIASQAFKSKFSDMIPFSIIFCRLLHAVYTF